MARNVARRGYDGAMHEPAAADRQRRALCLLAASAASSRAMSVQVPVPAPAPAPETGAFAAAPRAELDRTLQAAVAAARPPGAVLRVERDDGGHRSVWQQAWGRLALQPAVEPLEATAVYDAASLTKVVVTAPLVMRLIEEGRLAPDTPVQDLLGGVVGGEGGGGAGLTLRHLLTHSSGLPASLPLDHDWRGTAAAYRLARQQRPTHPPGTHFRYSDVNFILLGEIIERAAGQPLERLAATWIFEPLGMHDTLFQPLRRHAVARIAPTELVDGRPLRGEVHDPTARRMGGVAGHAGLFSTAADLARYARCLLGGGTLDGVRLLQPSSVAAMTTVASPPALAARRGLGWDIDSPYSRPRGKTWPKTSYGHTGFTGCVLWIDPTSRSFYVLLSNRVHPVVGESIVALYEAVGTLVGRL